MSNLRPLDDRTLMNVRPFIIPIFVPHLGCPHRCVFCDQHAITGASVSKPSPEWVRERIVRFLGYKGKSRGETEVAFYGGNFLGLDADYRDTLLEAVQPFIESDTVNGIRFSTRPDSISHEILQSVAPFHVRVVEIGAQSMDDRVLECSHRGHSAEDTEKAVTTLRSMGLRIGIQLMPGLPGDTAASMIESGRNVIRLRPEYVRLYPAVVVKGTVLEQWYLQERFAPLSLDDAVEITKQLYNMFTQNGVCVIRMGLHGDESLTSAGTVVAGPFHPAFGDLVYGAVMRDHAVAALDRWIKSQKHERLPQSVTLNVHPRHVSRLTGNRGQNLTILCHRFSIKEVSVVPDPSVPPGEVQVAGDGSRTA